MDCEVSFECNPEDITTDYVVWLFQLGINRLSIWVQSLNDETLKAIHRSDDGTIFSALDCIKAALESHKNLDISVNIDFILGLPHVERWETLMNIERLHKMYPCITHTSVYILEKWLYPKSWRNHTLDDSLIQEEFMDILDYFESLWWNHYEFSNWSQSWYESNHNRWYWDHSNSRWFWLSAASYVDGKRWNNSDSFAWYYRGVLLGEEVLTPEQVCIEDMMFGLRTHGIDVSAMGSIIDTTRMDALIVSGLLSRDDDRLKITKTWIFLVDYIIAELISR